MYMIRENMWGLLGIWQHIQEMIWPITVVVTVIILARLFAKRISKQACFCLWLVVAIRLICPVTVASEFSIFNIAKNPVVVTTVENNAGFFTHNPLTEEYEEVFSNNDIVAQNSMNESIQRHENNLQEIHQTNAESNINATIEDENNFFNSQWMLCPIWFLGVMVMLLYGLTTYYCLKRKLRFATKNKDGYFESDEITSPFVFGVLRPVIYLPCHLDEQEKNYILMHEQYHIKRRDYLIKLVAFGMLSVYWFHPFVWLAFYLMSQDMEMSCDEQVLKKLQLEDRKAYSTLLLSFACGKRFPLPSPLSFGENNVKSRIKQILSYKKPTVWASASVIVMILLVAVCCLTDAGDGRFDFGDENISEELPSENKIDLETGKLTEEYLTILSEKLYESKNPYIGDVPSNGKILNYLKEALDIKNTSGIELQTSQAPYWLTLSFTEKPNTKDMVHLATMFLALVDNASEFRWEYTDESTGEICSFYVNERLVNQFLTDEMQVEKGIKEYAKSAETIAELWRLFDKISTENDSSEYYRNKLIGESNWKNIANALGFDFAETNKWENRFIKDEILYNKDGDDVKFAIRYISSCIYEDFDENGQMDMAVLVSGDYGTDYGSRLFFYMNDTKDYYGTGFMDLCYGMDIQTGDIDHDGYPEFAFIAMSGGVGGAGSYCKSIYKYKDGEFFDMEQPGDYADYNLEWPSTKEMGYELEVSFGAKMDTYDIYCPTLDVAKTVYSPYLRDENGNLYRKPNPGEIVGGNCRGFYSLDITEINGKDYLIGTEAVMGDGGTAHCFADARFLLDWDEEKGWIVKDFDVISHDYQDDTIWTHMKTSLEYLPTTKEEIVEKHIPLIDYRSGEIIDPYNQLSGFALEHRHYNFDVTLTYATINTEGQTIYTQVILKNGKYYYLEDYTRLKEKPKGLEDYRYNVYSTALYDVQKMANGEYVEYFYLTNDENLTLEELQQEILSSVEPPNRTVAQIYHKVLDENGLAYYMRVTGDIIELGIQILLPENYQWIQSPNYYVLKEKSFEKPLAKVEYYDGIIFTDMTLLAGTKEDIMTQTDIFSDIVLIAPESWGARTLNNEYISIDFYVKPIDDIYKMAIAIWEYEGNTYALFGKTAAGDCSPVAKVAAYIIGQFEE